MSVRQRVLHSAPLIAFALAIVFLGLSLGGYDPADPPGQGAEPVNQPPANPCGPVGRRVRPHLVHHAGLVVLAAAAGPRRRQSARDRLAGPSPTGSARRSVSCSSLVVAAGFIHRLAPTLMPSPPVGSGGYIGRAGRDLPRGSLRTCRHDPDPRRRRTFRPGALPRRGLLLADPGDPRLAPPGRWRQRAATGPPHPSRLDPGGRADGAGDWETPGVIPATAIAQSVSMHPPIPVMNGRRRRRSPGFRPPAITHQRIPSPGARARSPGAASGRLAVRAAADGDARAADRPSRSRSTRPRSTPGPCCWSGPCSISATRSASSRSTPGR